MKPNIPQKAPYKTKGPHQRPFCCSTRTELLQVLADQASQFKHGDLGFAKYGLELVIGIDVALVDLVLQVVFFDVDPHFADYFRAWHGA